MPTLPERHGRCQSRVASLAVPGTTPDAGCRYPRADSWETAEPDEAEDSEGEAEGPGTLGEQEPLLILSEDENTGEERRSSASTVDPDDEDTMPEPDVIVIPDEEEDEEWHADGGDAQGQGELQQIPPPTVTTTYAKVFADGRWRQQVTLVCVWEEEAGLPPTWQLEKEQPPAGPNPSQRHRSSAPLAMGSSPPPPPEWRPPFLRQASCPEAGPRPTLPTL
ncbi:GH19604 [Drosophila grimshawi]|uniref:GH19604 n=1 Tax=Drosophila grimshawi TaxID=7222 RepID=B4JI26_DROGR|nr:GH19604 [Drosophila grimshawi]